MPRRFPERADQLSPAPLIRRLVAMLYDGLICIALLMVVTMIYTFALAGILGDEQYKALEAAGQMRGGPLLTSLMFVSLFLFFGYFWTRTGQTLGMQVWHLRVQNQDGSSISWLQALLRFMMGWVSWACLGLGWLWMLFGQERLSWTDRFSESRVYRIPKRYGKEAAGR